MKRIVLPVVLLVLMGSLAAPSKAQECTTIQEGVLLDSGGGVIETGYDVWGYNYQAHMFNGGYCDAYRDAAWCQPYRDIELIMKWNDAWLSNQDCDGDGLLDRHFGNENELVHSVNALSALSADSSNMHASTSSTTAVMKNTTLVRPI